MTKIYHHTEPFQLESGKILPQLNLAYTTLGQLNERKDNTVWIFHALTGNSDPAEWWPGLVGEGCLFDPRFYFIICVNMPGSCYGSLSPLDINPLTRKPYYHEFPLFTTRDMIRAYQHLKQQLEIKKIYAGIGGSMGGQQLLEWAIEEPQLFEHIIPIATNAQHSPWGIAFNTSQRLCIENDVTWKDKSPTAGIQGMKIARSIALISYRSYETYHHSQHGISTSSEGAKIDQLVYNAETYQLYQGEKLAKRFNAFSYYFLSKAMDTHNVGRERGSAKEALKKITAKTLVIGISSDILFPLAEQEQLAQNIPDAQFQSIYSLYGHDGFLLEYEKLTTIISNFLTNQKQTTGKNLSVQFN
jgi:homoserine O-acetyltransferase